MLLKLVILLLDWLCYWRRWLQRREEKLGGGPRFLKKTSRPKDKC